MKIAKLIGIVTILTLSSSAMALTIKIDGQSAVNQASAIDRSCDLFGKQSFTSDGNRTVFTGEESYSGNLGLRMTAPEGKTGFGTFGGIIDFRTCANDDEFKLTKGDEIWVRSRMLVPENWEFNSGRNKFLRLRTYFDDNGTVRSSGYNDLYIDGNPGGSNYAPFHFIYEGEQQWLPVGTTEDFFVPNVWKTIELYLKLDDKKASEGGDATVRVWLDGELIVESRERRTLARSDNYISNLNYFTYYGNELSPKDQSVYVDDIFITNETPINADAHGNPYVGLGDPSTRVEPNPPANVLKIIQ